MPTQIKITVHGRYPAGPMPPEFIQALEQEFARLMKKVGCSQVGIESHQEPRT